MSSDETNRRASTRGKGEWVAPYARPLTLLISCGIVLAATLLIVTGLVAGYLREQTLGAAEAGLSRLDAVLGESADRSLQGVVAVLADVTGRIPFPDISTPDEIARNMLTPAVTGHLDHRVEATEEIAGIAFVDSGGNLIASAGDWPVGETNVAARDYFDVLRTHTPLDNYIGEPYAARDGSLVIPVAHKLRGLGGALGGLAVAAVPVDHFSSLYRVVPLGPDGIISLVRRDGTVLAQYPAQAGTKGRALIPSPVLTAISDGRRDVFEEGRGDDGQWRISTVEPLPGFPAAIVISRNGDQALIGWSRQAGMFGAFAVCGVVAIGLMVFLIGRQIHTQGALAAIRAEKIEMEHARLIAEAELLKKERLSVLGQFTATVATELRNPLSAIRNTLFTMREIALTSGLTLDRPIARIQRSIARCDRIIGDLLEYIRTPELSRVAVSFDQWVHDVLAEHNLPPAVTLVEQYEAGDAIVRIDADRIRRVVINLVENAAQALGEMPPGDASRRIAVRSALGDGVLEFSVADTGPGIPPENIARIFEPLFSTKSFGAGLGLATVKQIVVQHGGTISVDSAIGRGTCVSIQLPIEQTLRVAA
jgi:signal transduction histidine kinase